MQKSYFGVTSRQVATNPASTTPNPNPNVPNITTPSVNVNPSTTPIANIVTPMGNLIPTPRPTSLFRSIFSGESSDNNAAQKGKKGGAHFCESVCLNDKNLPGKEYQFESVELLVVMTNNLPNPLSREVIYSVLATFIH